MSVLPLVAAQILIVASLPVAPPPPGVLAPNANLRGVPGAPPAPAPAAPEPFVDERGPRGHFYYSDECEDCVYKGAQCGCQAATEYFACLTKHCHTAKHSQFAAKCAAVATNCSSELDIVCSGPSTSCKGKFNQLPAGGIGLALNLSGVNDDAYCGPHGKCVGRIHMKATIHNAPQQTVVPVLAGGAPAPAAAAVFLECGLPIVPKADVENQTQWTLCRTAVVDGQAGCDLPMFPTLEAAGDKEAYCLLTEGTEGNPPKRLTQPAWHLISNVHDAPKNTTATVAAATSTGWFSWLW